MSYQAGVVRHAAAGWLFFIAACLGAGGCVQQQAQPAPQDRVSEPTAADYYHTVRYSGETLGIISGWYSGTSKNWERIAAANPGLRPERINIGQQILIPADILMRQEPLEESYVRKFYSSNPKSEAPAASADAAKPQQAAPAEGQAGQKEQQEDPFAALLEDENEPQAEPAAEDPTESLLKELTAGTKAEAEPSAAPKVEPSAPPAGSTTDEAERERLLDELLGGE